MRYRLLAGLDLCQHVRAHLQRLEYAAGKPAVPDWSSLVEKRSLFAFTRLWWPWTGTRGTNADPVNGEHRKAGPAG